MWSILQDVIKCMYALILASYIDYYRLHQIILLCNVDIYEVHLPLYTAMCGGYSLPAQKFPDYKKGLI